MTQTVLLVDDDMMVREALGQTLELNGLTVIAAGSYAEAKDHLHADFPGVVLSDIRMPGKDGFALLQQAQTVDPELPVILLTGEGDIPTAVRGMTEGAFDFLEKPCDPKTLLSVIGRALQTRMLVLENRALRVKAQTGDAAARLLIGESALAEDLRAQVRAAAATKAEVLIGGEPGSGTSKIAEVLHLFSGDATRPFIKLAAAGLGAGDLLAGVQRAEGGEPCFSTKSGRWTQACSIICLTCWNSPAIGALWREAIAILKPNIKPVVLTLTSTISWISFASVFQPFANGKRTFRTCLGTMSRSRPSKRL